MVDFGFVLNDTISLRQGARDGARHAVVSNVGTNSSCTLTGFAGVDGSDTDRIFCLVKERVGLNHTNFRVKIDFETTFTAKKSLAVCVMYPIRSVSGLSAPFLSGAFKTEVQMRIEETNVVITEAQETALTGQNWSWCVAEVTS